VKIRPGSTPNQFVIEAPLGEAAPALERAIGAVGKVTKSDLSSGSITGWGKYGLNKVKVTAALMAQDGDTVVTIAARSGSFGSSPVRSVIDRIKDAVVNDGNRGFEADRAGVSTSIVVFAVAVVAIGVAIGLVLVLGFLGI
jgi:hypothetical protein